jgi:hypothetical protein
MYAEFRGDSLYLANLLFPRGRAVEIGILEGDFSEHALGIWPTAAEYRMVDRWQNIETDFYQHTEERFDRVSQKFASPPYNVVRNDSLSEAKQTPPGYYDWVYLDDEHSFTHVSKELDAWWPAVSTNGILAGHDYSHDHCWPLWMRVKDAVDMWAKNNQQAIYHSVDFQDWWTIKSQTPPASDLLVLSDSHQQWGARQHVIENHLAYCNHWGYEYKHEDHFVPGYVGPWMKVFAILDAMDSTDKPWICWFDADFVVTDFTESQHKHCHSCFEMILGGVRNAFHPHGGPNTSHWLLKNNQSNKGILQEILKMRHWANRYCCEENALDELLNCRNHPSILLVDSQQWSLDPRLMSMKNLVEPSPYLHISNGHGSLRVGTIIELCEFAQARYTSGVL